jgi:butyryl-CoA dehydrogenase
MEHTMNVELIPAKELEFQLYQVLDTQNLCQQEHFSEHNKETQNAKMDTANKIATEKFSSHNSKADGKSVPMIEELQVAFNAGDESGLIAGGLDFEEGGMQIPQTITMTCAGYFIAANAPDKLHLTLAV